MTSAAPHVPEWTVAPHPLESGTEYLKDAREIARSEFLRLGFPTTKHEEWKYTNLAALAKIPFERAQKVSVRPAFPDWGTRAAFINGFFDPTLSSLQNLPKGVEIQSFSGKDSKLRQAVQSHFNRHVAHEAFTALNTSQFEDGVVVFVPRNTVLEKPIHIAFHTARGKSEAASSSYLRVLVMLEENANATLIEDFSGDDSVYFSNAVTEIVLAPGAHLTHTRIQHEGPKSYHVSSVGVCQERDSHYSARLISLGGNLARQDLDIRLVGKGAECRLSGFFIGEKSQHIDQNIKVEHRTSHTHSTQFVKGIVGDQATGVFEGQIFVDKDAQKTDAVQTSKNLLLSADANIYTKPALEIYANDVKCSHGATVGELDAEAVFYLRARGISENEARSLLTRAFLNEIIETFEFGPLREEVERLSGAKLQSFLGGGKA